MTRKLLQPTQPIKKAGTLVKVNKELTEAEKKAIEEIVSDPVFVVKQGVPKKLPPPQQEKSLIPYPEKAAEIVTDSEVPVLLKRPSDVIDAVDASVKADVKNKLGTASLLGGILAAASMMPGDEAINQADAEAEGVVQAPEQTKPEQQEQESKEETEDPVEKAIEQEIDGDKDKAEQAFEDALKTVTEEIAADPQEAKRFKDTLGDLLNQTMQAIEQLDKAEQDLDSKLDKKIAQYLMLEYLGNAAAAISKYALAYFYADRGTPVNPEAANYMVSLKNAMDIEVKRYQAKLQSLNNQKEALLKNVQKFTELAAKEEDRQYMLEKMREEYALREKLQDARNANDQALMSKYLEELRKLETEKLQALQKATALEKESVKEGREMELDVTKLAKDFAETIAKLPEAKREKYVEQMAAFLGVPVAKKKVSVAGIELFSYGVDTDKTAEAISQYLGDRAKELSKPPAQESIEQLKTKTSDFVSKEPQTPAFSSPNPKDAVKEIETKALEQAEKIIKYNLNKHQEGKLYSGEPLGIKRKYMIRDGQVIWQ